MNLYPAIDILEGRAVRLRQGRKEDATVYGTPVEMARQPNGCPAAKYGGPAYETPDEPGGEYVKGPVSFLLHAVVEFAIRRPLKA